MAGGAVFRRRLVEKNLFPVDPLGQFVTLSAARFLMRALQRELRPLVMIEQCGLPFRAVVTVDATGHVVLCELLPVDVLVAVFALLWRRLEVDIGELGFEVGWLVAVSARGSAMGAEQREVCLGVVETRQFLPVFGGMAGFAAERLTIDAGNAHALLELSLVRVGVAGCAVEFLPMIDGRFLFADGDRFLVAVGAQDRGMRSRQKEARLLMPREREGGRLVSVKVMALVATVQPRRSGKLRRVPIGVAIGAGLELDLVKRVLTLGDMALLALDLGVSALQGICTRCVLFYAELCGLESIDGVAFGTLASRGAFGKLSVMRVGFVTVYALVERHSLLEIALSVALGAFHLEVFAEEGILGF